MTDTTAEEGAASLLQPSVFSGLPGIVAGFTLRAFAGPDVPRDDVRAALASRFGVAVASVGQVHGARVATVRSASHVPDHDALVTDRAGVLLTTLAADCALVLLADANAGVVGACHSGWRGTVGGIVGATVSAMEALGARTDAMRAYVTPCISAEAFEVGDDVASRFGPHAVVRRPDWPRPHVDLRADLARQLVAAGVPESATEISAACTVGEPGRFYSYRGEAGTSGRMVGFIGRRG